MSYKEKYLKYKVKYQHLINNQEGGNYNKKTKTFSFTTETGEQKNFKVGEEYMFKKVTSAKSKPPREIIIVEPNNKKLLETNEREKYKSDITSYYNKSPGNEEITVSNKDNITDQFITSYKNIFPIGASQLSEVELPQADVTSIDETGENKPTILLSPSALPVNQEVKKKLQAQAPSTARPAATQAPSYVGPAEVQKPQAAPPSAAQKPQAAPPSAAQKPPAASPSAAQKPPVASPSAAQKPPAAPPSAPAAAPAAAPPAAAPAAAPAVSAAPPARRPPKESRESIQQKRVQATEADIKYSLTPALPPTSSSLASLQPAASPAVASPVVASAQAPAPVSSSQQAPLSSINSVNFYPSLFKDVNFSQSDLNKFLTVDQELEQREQAAREQEAQEKAAQEQAAQEQAAQEKAAQEQAAQAAREQAAREQAASSSPTRSLSKLAVLPLSFPSSLSSLTTSTQPIVIPAPYAPLQAQAQAPPALLTGPQSNPFAILGPSKQGSQEDFFAPARAAQAAQAAKKAKEEEEARVAAVEATERTETILERQYKEEQAESKAFQDRLNSSKRAPLQAPVSSSQLSSTPSPQPQGAPQPVARQAAPPEALFTAPPAAPGSQRPAAPFASPPQAPIPEVISIDKFKKIHNTGFGILNEKLPNFDINNIKFPSDFNELEKQKSKQLINDIITKIKLINKYIQKGGNPISKLNEGYTLLRKIINTNTLSKTEIQGLKDFLEQLGLILEYPELKETQKNIDEEIKRVREAPTRGERARGEYKEERERGKYKEERVRDALRAPPARLARGESLRRIEEEYKEERERGEYKEERVRDALRAPPARLARGESLRRIEEEYKEDKPTRRVIKIEDIEKPEPTVTRVKIDYGSNNLDSSRLSIIGAYFNKYR